MKRLAGKFVVITGAARGQGAAELRQCVAEGAEVLATDVLRDEGKALAAALGPAVEFLEHDVADEAAWNAVAERVRQRGRLDGLVNNAGIYRPEPIASTDAALFDLHYRVNQLGAFFGIRMAAEVGGAGTSIAIISSLAGLRASRGIAYVGTKWAIRGMTKAAAQELGPRGIRINSVHPGMIDTRMLDVWSEDQRESRMAMIPMRRIGTAEDVADLVCFLLSDASSYISGAEIAIDGGLSV